MVRTSALLSATFVAFVCSSFPVSCQSPVPTPAPQGAPKPVGVNADGTVEGDGGAPKPIQGAPDEFRTGMGNDWFEETRKHLGTYYQEESAIGKFKFKNPRDVPHQLRGLTQSCQCARSVITVGDRVYHLTNEPENSTLYRVQKDDNGVENRTRVAYVEVGAGEAGEIEVHMTMQGFQGNKEATLRMNTTDETVPLVNLMWRAVGATYFVVTPPDWNLGEMTWEDKREFEFEVSSGVLADFELTDHDPLVRSMAVTAEKSKRGDKVVWLVKGTYGPGVDERDSGGIITYRTNVPGRNVTMRVAAMIKGPLEFKPGGFLSMNLIRSGVGAKSEVTIAPTDSFDLQIVKLEVERLSVDEEFVKVTSSKEGKELRVQIEVMPNVPKGKVVRGKVRIHLNHPSCSVKEVSFHGMVR